MPPTLSTHTPRELHGAMMHDVPTTAAPGHTDAVPGLGTARAAAVSDVPRSLPPDDTGSDADLADDSADGQDEQDDTDDNIYGDQDDARSFIQPNISPMATRLSSAKTPAAEKAKAMGVPGLPALEGGSPSSPGGAPGNPQSLKPAPTGPYGNYRSSAFQTRHGRSSSVGSDALKRLSKALPSISILPSLSTPSFLSSVLSSSSSSSSSPPKTLAHSRTQPGQAARPQTAVARSQTHTQTAVARSQTHTQTSQAQPQNQIEATKQAQPMATRPKRAETAPVNGDSLRPETLQPPRRPPYLRRSTSDDSMLYHTLSKVSSLGDHENFDHIHDQVNSRFKAIMDSFDRPSFRLSSLFLENSAPSEPQHPLDAALESLTGDVVIMGGYRGSILRSAEPPHRQLWVPVKVGLNIRKVNLEVGLDPEDELNMEKTIYPSGMLQHIGPVDISRRLFRKMRESENARKGKLHVHDYGYDWRLSPHLLSERLIKYLERLPCNDPEKTPPEKRGALVIAHSLGGLMTRHAVNKRPELFSGVIFAGTPQRCVNILGPLRFGDAVLLNEKVLTAQVHFSMRTSFLMLPEDGYCFVNSKDPTQEYRVDFYDANNWIKYRLSPCIGPPAAPPYNASSKRSSTIGSLLDLRKNGETAGAAAAAAADAPETTDIGILPDQAKNFEYLKRTLSEIKQFRSELVHRPEHTKANAYPPMAIIYGKGIPTLYAAGVTDRAAIPCSDCYDDLQFRSGDGVILARESMLPEGYDLVKGGFVSTDRGHVSMLGDHVAVGKALEAVVRGRQKGIGLGRRGMLDLAEVAEVK